MRCHDDIGWAVADEDAWAVGLDPAAHRRFLADFYAGRHPGSFAPGSTSRSTPAPAAVARPAPPPRWPALESALRSGSEVEVRTALRRLELLYAVAYSYGGIPLVYMGDELALLNDAGWADDPAHAEDNRWVHRPAMDWAALRRRRHRRRGTHAGRAAAPGSRPAAASRRCAPTPAPGCFEHDNPHVLAYVREHPRHAPLLVLACFSDEDQYVGPDVLGAPASTGRCTCTPPPARWSSVGDHLRLPAWGYLWLRQQD